MGPSGTLDLISIRAVRAAFIFLAAVLQSHVSGCAADCVRRTSDSVWVMTTSKRSAPPVTPMVEMSGVLSTVVRGSMDGWRRARERSEESRAT